MQDSNPSDSPPLLKECPHCGKAVLRSGLTCPYCSQLISETDEKDPKRHSRSPGANDFQGPKIPFLARRNNRVYALTCLTTAVVFFIAFFLFPLMVHGPKIMKPTKLQWPSDIPESDPNLAKRTIPGSEKQTSVYARDIMAERLGNGKTDIGSTPDWAGTASEEVDAGIGTSSHRDDERGRKIEEVLPLVLENLRKSEAITTDTIFLRSGNQVKCAIVGESEARVEIQRRGFTITIAKEKIEKIESRTLEDVERELQKLALARAAKIVDEDLVREGQNWAPRKETAKYNIELLYSLLRQRKPIETEFLHGQLSLYPRISAQPESGVNESSTIVFEAKAIGLSISALRKMLSLPIRASGACDIDATAKVDELNPTKFSGRVSVTGKDIRVSSVDLEIFSLPRSSGVALDVSLLAKDGEIQVERLTMKGTGYDLSGTGKIRLSRLLENSPINISFSIIFKEPPTLKSRELIALGAEHFMDRLVTARTKLPFKLIGTLESPKIQMARGSSALATPIEKYIYSSENAIVVE